MGTDDCKSILIGESFLLSKSVQELHPATFWVYLCMAAESGESCETAGRRLRYEFFGQLMSEHGFNKLATAHHRDDNAETIKKRLDVYHNQTAPLIEWYKNEGVHHHINGLGELNRIFGDICSVIDAL